MSGRKGPGGQYRSRAQAGGLNNVLGGIEEGACACPGETERREF